MSVHPIRQMAREVHHKTIEAGLFFHGGRETTVSVSGVTAHFNVSNWKEYWRATTLMDEREIVSRFVSEISAGDVVWDIGAAVGTYSILAANAGAKVVAFEPIASNYQRLAENANINCQGDRVDVQAVALSDSVGTAPLRLSRDGLKGEGEHRIVESGDVSVPTMPGDQIDAPAPDVVKIDVEGHELAVLRGMENCLRDARAVLVEVHHQHDVTTDEVDSLLSASGFDVTVLEGDRSESHLLGVSD